MSETPHHHGGVFEAHPERIPGDTEFATVADIFKKLDDSNRLKIFWILCHSEECVMNLSALMDMSSPAVSHHLKLLKAGELIASRREGKEVYYRASDSIQAQSLHHAIEHIMAITCP